MHQLKGGHSTEDPRLGAIPYKDPRNRDYPISAEVPASTVVRKGYACRVRLDQGQEPACVGFAVSAELNAKPVEIPVNNDSGRSIYHAAQERDPWPGHDYPGTTLQAGVEEAQVRGYYSGYRWAFSVDDVLRALTHEGPVIVATQWLGGMYFPSPRGVVHPSGDSVGGHAYLVRGFDLHKRWKLSSKKYTAYGAYLSCQNSWGRGYGQDGRFWLPIDEFENVLMHHPAGGAEMAVPVGRCQS